MTETMRRAIPILLFLFATTATGAGAQTLTLEGAGGIVVPSGELSDLADGSASVQVAAAYPVHERVLLRAVGSVDLLSGKEVEAPGFPAATPDIELWSAGAGVEAIVTPLDWPWSASLRASGLVTSFNTEIFDQLVFDPETEELVGDFAETYLGVGIGATLSYELRSRLRVFVAAEWRQMFADETDTAVFGALSPEVEAFDSASWIPVTAGLRYGLRF